MAPIIIAAKNNGVPIPAFRERGVQDLMPAPVSECPILAMPGDKTSQIYESQLSEIAQIGRVQLDSVISFKSGPTGIMKRIKVPFYFDRPNASFIIDASTEQRNTLAGMGLTEEPGRKNVFVGSPDAEHLPLIFAMGPADGRIHPGTCTADAYYAYISGLRAMALFSAATRQIVPGFANMRIETAYVCPHIGKDADFTFIHGDGKLGKVDMTFLGDPISFQRAVAGQFMKGYVNWDQSKTITPVVYDSTSAPVDKGIFFPYFPGMVLPDKNTLVDTFESIFISCLSDKAEVRLKLWSSLRPGFKNLALFRAGQAMSHAFIGMKLAKAARGCLAFVVSNSQYQGFVIHGDFQIGLYGSIFSPEPAADLRISLESLNKHSKALGEIVGILTSVCREDGTRLYDIAFDDVNTSRKLANVLYNIDYNMFISTSWRDDLKALFAKLEFGDHFPVPTPATVTVFLDFVANGNLNTLRDYPFLITDRILVEKDRVSFGLAMFGTKVPSLNYGEKKGKSFTIPSANVNDPNLVEDAQGKRALAYLPFKFQSYSAAVSEWRSFINSGSFTIPQPTKKGGSQFTDTKHVNLQISGVNFLPAYGLLKIIVDANRGGAGGSGKKRKADGQEKGSSKKARADTMSMAADI